MKSNGVPISQMSPLRTLAKLLWEIVFPFEVHTGPRPRYGYNAASGMTYPTDPEESWRSAIDPFGPR